MSISKNVTQSKYVFGIPVDKGNLLSQDEHGFIVSFNMEHFFIRRLLSGQLYNQNQKPLTLNTVPSDLRELFQYPMVRTSPDFALSQKENFVIAFIKKPKIAFSAELRIVFWYQRNVIPAVNDNDSLDVPEEYIPLVLDLSKRDILIAQGKNVPLELEQNIKRKIVLMKLEGNTQNYYLSDTLNLTLDDIEKLSQNYKETSEEMHKEEYQKYGCCDEKDSLKEIVFNILKKNEPVVLEKLHKRELRQNKKWKLSTSQVWIKFFKNYSLVQKDTILRYIKAFRSEKSISNPK